QHYPLQGSERFLDLDSEDTVDHLIELMLFVAGAGRAPTAQHEIDVLDGVADPIPGWADLKTAGGHAVRGAAEYLRQPSAGRSRSRSLVPSNSVKRAILRAGGRDGRELNDLGSEDMMAAAGQAYASNTDIGASAASSGSRSTGFSVQR